MLIKLKGHSYHGDIMLSTLKLVVCILFTIGGICVSPTRVIFDDGRPLGGSCLAAGGHVCLLGGRRPSPGGSEDDVPLFRYLPLQGVELRDVP